MSSYTPEPGVAHASSVGGLLGRRAARPGRRVATVTHYDPVAGTVTHIDHTQPVARGVPHVTARVMEDHEKEDGHG